MNFDESNKKMYKVEAIHDNKIYIKELEMDSLSKYHYLVFWKGYSEKKNI